MTDSTAQRSGTTPQASPEAGFSLQIPERIADPFGVYVHVPFCASRCGYCDFNTYTAGELGSSASPESWLDAIRAEIREAASRMAEKNGRPPSVETVFFGGGTPSLVGSGMLNAVLAEIRESFGLAPGAEVTTESNPESVSPEFFEELLGGGFTRISLGMQSTSSRVLQILDRAHTPGRALDAAREALDAGFGHVSLDVIYGTPGESDADLAKTLDDALGTGIDHLSAYSLIVEDGTALARKVRRGEIATPLDDVFARRYEMVAARMAEAGFDWYEVSNWARGEAGQCRHNMGYWRDGDWWGFGPGAHGHLGGQRWWNVKHPARYAAASGPGQLPIADGETLDDVDRHIEQVMLRMRLAEGIPARMLTAAERERLVPWIERGLAVLDDDTTSVEESVEPRYRVTDAGRLMADGIVRDIIEF